MSIVSIRGFKLFSGGANRPLALKVAKELGVSLGDVEVVRFKDNECRVWVKDDVRGKNVFVIQPLSNPVDENLMELALLGDAIERGGSASITAVVPYYGYARQDRAHRVGEPISARVVAKIIETVGYDEIITMDMHTDAIMGFFKIPMQHLFGLSVFVDKVKMKNLAIVAPDVGGVKRARSFAVRMGDVPIIVIEKERDLNHMHTSRPMEVIGDPKGKTCVIVDDVITTGSTIRDAADALLAAGAKEIYVCATHGDFIAETKEVLGKAKIEKIFVTDSVELPSDFKFKNLEIVSISSLLAGTIKDLVS